MPSLGKLLQRTLDLFDPAPPPERPALPPTDRTGGALAAAAATAESLEAVLAPATFHHPQANRQAVLAGTFVAYEFKRGRRRSIGFSIGPEGLTVSAPKWVPLGEVDAAVQGKASWILSKLDAARERRERVESARISWKDGASFPFLGEQVIVVLDSRGDSGAILNTDAQALPGVPRLTLHVALPQTANPAQIRDAVQAWLMRQARRLFTERLDHYAPQLLVQWKKLVLSNAGTRWGTAHSDGTIRLNWRLIHFRLPVIDYVVAHELSHLRVMDHSPRFWETVATVVPHYEQLRGQLRDEPLAPW
ncbi:MAG: SprT family zinc-dependent metalloprotease [Ramlibacter sp.]